MTAGPREALDIMEQRQAGREYRDLFHEMLDGFALHEIILDEGGTPIDYRFLAVNPAFEQLTGLKAFDVVGHTVLELMPETESRWIEAYGRVALTGEDAEFESYSAALNRHFEVRAYRPGPHRFACVFRDVTERKKDASRAVLRREVLDILSGTHGMENAAERLVAVVKAEIGVDAVAIRLQQGNDFPYLAQVGFSSDFLLAEDTLIERDADGGVCRGQNGEVTLACVCGLILSDEVDATDPNRTPAGSFWTNDSRSLLGLPHDQDPRHHSRNRCIHDGYASMAMVPLRDDVGVVGLLKLNDRREGYLTLETVEFLEEVALLIGGALARKRAEGKLRVSEQRLNESQALARIGHYRYDIEADRWDGSSTLDDVLGIDASYDRDLAAWLRFVHPDDLERVTRSISEDALGGRAGSVEEYRIVRPRDGAERWIRGISSIESTEDGDAVAVFGTVQDVTKRKQAELDASLYRQRLSDLTAERANSMEQVRRKIAVELHEGVAQVLTAAKMNAAQLVAAHDAWVVPEDLARLMSLLDDSVDGIRRITSELSPSVLFDLGLGPAVEWLADEYRDLDGLVCEVSVDTALADLKSEPGILVFRIVRELLDNVVRHSGGSVARVEVTSLDNMVVARVEDDGCGFDTISVVGPCASTAGFGLFAIREQVIRVGGTVEIDAEPGRGTRVDVRLLREPMGVPDGLTGV